MIEQVTIESDEAGFELVLTGDFSEAVAGYEADDGCRLRLRLPQDAAVRLLAAARAELGPWVAEMEHERAAYERATPAERAAVLRLCPDCRQPWDGSGSCPACGLSDEDVAVAAEFYDRLAAAGDDSRKRRKESRWAPPAGYRPTLKEVADEPA